jgi:hypothetical protein
LLALGCSASLQAQSSTNYQIEQGTFNNGGNPSPVLSSTSYQMTLDAIGDGLNATGLASSSYGMDPGFPSAYPPPGEVLNLRLPGKTVLTWAPEPSIGVYRVYRGALADLPASYGSVISGDDPDPSDATYTDDDAYADQPWFYLVTASNRLNEEGTKGRDSVGNPRP